MNLLGHALVSPLAPAILAGSLGGDIVKGRLEGRFSIEVERGLRLHRAVDSFVDFHPGKAALRESLQTKYRRYADVMFDIAADQVLALTWTDFADGTLESFCERAYKRLSDLPVEVPGPISGFCRRIVEYDLLKRGEADDYLDRSFSYLSRRAPLLLDAASEVRRCEREFDVCVRKVWPDLVAMVRGRVPSAAPNAFTWSG